MTDILKVIIGVVLGSFLWELITALRHELTKKKIAKKAIFVPFEKLEVGETYIARNGNHVKIIKKLGSLFLGDNLNDYYPNGRLSVAKKTEFDLIGKKP